MSTELLALVKENPHFETLENGKIRCKLTNHEISADLAKYTEYINSKGYQKAIEKNFDFNQYKPHIVPHRGAEENFLWCHLTRTKVPKMKNVILRHTQGRKFQRLIQLFNQKKQEREERKKITLMKCKRVSLEEEDDKFDERFIDQMINEFEEDERLNDNELEGDESYSDQIYEKINHNFIQEEASKAQKKKADKRNLKNAKKNQQNNHEGIEEEEDDEEQEGDDDEEEEEEEEEIDSQDEQEDDEELSENEEEDEEEGDEIEEEEVQVIKQKEEQKENDKKKNNKFQNKNNQQNGNNNQNVNKQGKNIKKQKQNNFHKFNKNKFQKK